METSDLPALLEQLQHTRRTVLPKRLLAPGPDAAQLQQLLRAACTAPDHGQLRPWSLVLVAQPQRPALGAAFAQALLERDADATPEQQAQAHDKALRAPLLLLLVVDGACGDSAIDLHERIVAAGCAVQNLLLMATAQGFGSALTSGKALQSAPLRTLLGLQEQQYALCCISIGTVQSQRPTPPRPDPQDILRQL